MPSVQETITKVNELAYDGRANVTTSAQKLKEIFTDLTISGIKNLRLRNLGSAEIYYGNASTVTTSTAGGVLPVATVIEFPLENLDNSPYFIAGANQSLAIEAWK